MQGDKRINSAVKYGLHIDGMDEENDNQLMMIAAERMEHYDPATTISEKEMLLRFGFTEDDLRGFDEVEIE